MQEIPLLFNQMASPIFLKALDHLPGRSIQLLSARRVPHQASLAHPLDQVRAQRGLALAEVSISFRPFWTLRRSEEAGNAGGDGGMAARVGAWMERYAIAVLTDAPPF